MLYHMKQQIISLRFCNYFTALLLIYAGYKTLKYFEHTFFCNRQNGGFDTSKGPKKWGKDMWYIFLKGCKDS